MGFTTCNHDVSQPYLQSAGTSLRDVYLKPSKEFEISSNEVVKLLKPLYGLAGSGDYWSATVSDHIKNDLGMEATAGDISLFFKLIHSKLSGLICSYVDNSLIAGDPEFLSLTDKKLNKIENKPMKMPKFKFAGVYIETVQY